MGIYYKGFGIIKKGNKWQIYLNGEIIIECKTLNECKNRIDTQTVSNDDSITIERR